MCRSRIMTSSNPVTLETCPTSSAQRSAARAWMQGRTARRSTRGQACRLKPRGKRPFTRCHGHREHWDHSTPPALAGDFERLGVFALDRVNVSTSSGRTPHPARRCGASARWPGWTSRRGCGFDARLAGNVCLKFRQSPPDSGGAIVARPAASAFRSRDSARPRPRAIV